MSLNYDELPENHKVTRWVRHTLIEGANHIKRYSVGKAVVTKELVGNVASKIGTEIKVGLLTKSVQRAMGSPAAYLKQNVILIPGRASKANLVELQGICVHEAIHAVNDLRKLQLPVEEDEAAAHIGEAMYLLAKQIDLSEMPRLYREAANVARLFTSKGRASNGAISLLLREVRIYYQTGLITKQMTTYDGI